MSYRPERWLCHGSNPTRMALGYVWRVAKMLAMEYMFRELKKALWPNELDFDLVIQYLKWMAHHLHQLVMMKHLRYNTTTTTFSLNYIDFSSEQIFESDTHSQSLDISIVMTNLETRQCFTNFPTKSSRCTLYEKLKIKVCFIAFRSNFTKFN